LSNVQAGDLDYLLEHDQLRKEMRTNHAFRLRSFEEATITFAPTYKYNSGTNDYDSSEKRRIPAWCDRILFRKCAGIECIDYRRYEPTVSDHKPVSAGFNMKVKSIDKLRMQEVKVEIGKEWAKKEGELLERVLNALPDLL
jgi:endonuclease/exonuclease/phosphatase family metal-dependent hydrolase